MKTTNTNSVMKRFSILLVFLLSLSSQTWADDPLKTSLDAAKRFSEGYQGRDGHLGDKLIEGMIEASTPEADEATREVQRGAIKFTVDPNKERSQGHWNDVEKGIHSMVSGSGHSLETSGDLPVTAGQSGYFITTETYDGLTDYPKSILERYDGRFEVVDWSEIKENHAENISGFLDQIGMAKGDSVLVTSKGKTRHSSSRAYFISRHEKQKPGHYLAHDQIGGYYLSLGSWQGTRKVLLKRTDKTEDRVMAAEGDARAVSRPTSIIEGRFSGVAHELRTRKGEVLQDREIQLYEVEVLKKKDALYSVRFKTPGQGNTIYGGFVGYFRPEGNRLVGGVRNGAELTEGNIEFLTDGSIRSDSLVYTRQLGPSDIFTWKLSKVKAYPLLDL